MERKFVEQKTEVSGSVVVSSDESEFEVHICRHHLAPYRHML